MGEVHRILELHGKQGALALGEDRPTVEAASSYLSDENAAIGFLYSGWCQAALPHRQLPPDQRWQIVGEHVTLIVEPGSRPGKLSGPLDAEPVGVPYGSRARLIMLYLQSEAMRTHSREVQLGRSMRDWLGRMNVPIGGKSLLGIRDQAERISRCRLSINTSVEATRRGGLLNQSIVDGAIFLDQNEINQSSLFIETARLSEGFYSELVRHSVPLEEAAIRAISNNSIALDLYAWLAYRLYVLKGPTPVSWSALHTQFGPGFRDVRNFRTKFLLNLRLALAVYPEAKVDVTERGVTMHNSRPPVAPKVISGSNRTLA